MSKTPNKTNFHDPQKTFLVKKVAEIHKVTEDYVYKILGATRDNDEIFKTYMDLLEGSNALVEEVKKLIPFN